MPVESDDLDAVIQQLEELDRNVNCDGYALIREIEEWVAELDNNGRAALLDVLF